MVNLKSGFSKCGIFPFNENVVSEEKMAPSTAYHDSSSEESSQESDPLPAGEIASEAASVPVQNTSDQHQSTSSAPTTSVHVSANSITPPLFSSPNTSGVSSTCENCSQGKSPVNNPLLTAGLIPSNLADILSATDPEPQPKRRRIKARVLTEDDYYQLLKDKEKKEEEEKVAKEKRRVEREKKKEEKEKLKFAKAQSQEKKKREKEGLKEAQRKKKSSAQKRKQSPVVTSGSDSEVEFDSNPPGPSMPKAKRRCRLPARYKTNEDSSETSGNDSDTLCGKCNQREPKGSHDKHVFWIDCDRCDMWFHVLCVFQKNRTKNRYVCENCA